MKYPLNLLGRVILLTLVSLLFSCATTQQTSREGERHTIDLGDYMVDVPSSEDWQIQVDKERGIVIFAKEKGKGMRILGQVLGGPPIIRGITLIQIFRNAVKDSPKCDLSEEEMADDYRNNEENVMLKEGVAKGEYNLEDVKKGVITIDGKRLYFMSYKAATAGSWMGATKAVEGTLYLYFPPDFKTNHIFYGFLISESYFRKYFMTVDLTQIYPVINSFQLKERQINNE